MNVQELDISSIYEKQNSRINIGDLAELMQSIKSEGLLQPIIVSPDNTGRYYVLAGHRRYNACKKLGMAYIPSIISEGFSASDELIVNIVENLQRTNISAFEEGQFYNKLHSDYMLSIAEIAARVCKSSRHVKDMMIIANSIPEEFRKVVVPVKQTEKNKKSLIPISAAKFISDSGIAGEAKIELYNLFKKKEVNLKSIASIRELRGISTKTQLNKVLKESEKLKSYSVRMLMDKNKAEKMAKKYNISISKLISGILTGKINERIEIFND